MPSNKWAVFICLIFTSLTMGDEQNNRSDRRLRIPLLGIGYTCSGCPQHFCDDDPAIIHGYCCGCARFYDHLPIKCSSLIRCPLNGYELCERYEYMMQCCCGS